MGSPYIPANWQPAYHYLTFDTGRDTTSGFVLDTADTPSLVYRHKAGAGYPAICRLAPYNNYEWQDYVLRGKIEKPTDAAYDSVAVGVIFYQEDEGRYYSIMPKYESQSETAFRLRSHYIGTAGTGVADTLHTYDFNDADTVYFAVQVTSGDTTFGTDSTIKDAKAIIKLKLWNEGEEEPGNWFDPTKGDDSNNRKISGYCGIIVNNRSKELLQTENEGIKIKDIKLEKVIE